jgi:hypothetical protein
VNEIRVDRERVEGREIDGELVIYDMAARRYLGGNATAAALWPLLVEGTDLDAMARALVSAYAIDAERARSDAAAFASSLRERGLLVDGEA